MFDDTNLHDAANESDEVRVVLWLDVARKLPRTLALYNRALLEAVYYEPSVRRFRENAVVRMPAPRVPLPERRRAAPTGLVLA